MLVVEKECDLKKTTLSCEQGSARFYTGREKVWYGKCEQCSCIVDLGLRVCGLSTPTEPSTIQASYIYKPGVGQNKKFSTDTMCVCEVHSV